MKFLKMLIFCVVSISLSACQNSSFDVAMGVTETADNMPSSVFSRMTISSSNWADGVTAAIINLEIKNGKNKPLAGILMKLAVGGSQNTVIPCPETDLTGRTSCKIYSTKAETKTVVAAGLVSLQGSTVFLPPQYTKSIAGIVSSGDFQRLNNGRKIVSSAGIAEGAVVQKDGTGTVRAHSSIQSKMLAE